VGRKDCRIQLLKMCKQEGVFVSICQPALNKRPTEKIIAPLGGKPLFRTKKELPNR